jgi:phosphoesterase RecJ-like protein
MISKTKIKNSFLLLVNQSKHIVITSHYSPDDDAIASTLAVYNWVISQNDQTKVEMIITGGYINRYSEFLHYRNIKFVSDLSSHLEGVDLLVMVDGSQYSRFSRNPEIISSHNCKKVCFDHHSSPIDKFDLIYLDKQATSASEIIMDVLYTSKTISKVVAEVLLLGILGDTGTFNYLKPNQLNTLDNVKTLLEISKVEIQEFKARYSKISQSTFILIQEYIKNTKFIDLPNNMGYQYSFITDKFIKENKLSDGETSEAGHVYMTHYLRTIEGYSWGFIATPKKDEISVSFRSLPGSVNVRSVVESIGVGGGHDRAAGSGFKPEKWGNKLNLNFTINYLIEWISSHKLELS